MRILCTFPGRYGDLLWALPSIRALSRRMGAPVDLAIAGEFASIVPLLQGQAYLGKVRAHLGWSLTPPNEWLAPNEWDASGRIANAEYDAVFHLGYRGWPSQGLPFETLENLNTASAIQGSKWTRVGRFTREALDLSTPWITVPRYIASARKIVFGFAETHVELKVGLITLLERTLTEPILVVTHPGTVYDTVRPTAYGTYPVYAGDWIQQAGALHNADVALCCNSALHVLAVAVGTPVVLYEPMASRHNPIFLPLGTTGSQVTIPLGNDGQPTLDYRHVGETITRVLAQRRNG